MAATKKKVHKKGHCPTCGVHGAFAKNRDKMAAGGFTRGKGKKK